jgi:hypothetical protein
MVYRPGRSLGDWEGYHENLVHSCVVNDSLFDHLVANDEQPWRKAEAECAVTDLSVPCLSEPVGRRGGRGGKVAVLNQARCRADDLSSICNHLHPSANAITTESPEALFTVDCNVR